MHNRVGTSLTTLALLAPATFAAGGENEDELKNLSIPSLQGVTVEASPGKGVTFKSGEDFSLNIYNRLQVQWRFSNLEDAPDVSTFRIRRARTKLSGHVFDAKTQYQLMMDWAAGGSYLLDAWIMQQVWANEEWKLNVRGGAGKTYYGREATGTSGGLEFVERSLAARTFSDVRADGLMAWLNGMEEKLHAYMGVWNTDQAGGSLFAGGSNGLNTDNELNYSIGAIYDLNKPMGAPEKYRQGDLERTQDWNASFHGNIWMGNEGGAPLGPDVEIFAFNVGGVFKGHGIHGLAEFFSYDADIDGVDDASSTGWNVQGSYNMDGGWAFGARISMVKIDDTTAASALLRPTSAGSTGGGTTLVGAGDVTEITLGASKYLNAHDRKVQADITLQSVDPDVGNSQDNIIFRLMATIGI
jgi:hypothetical protein